MTPFFRRAFQELPIGRLADLTELDRIGLRRMPDPLERDGPMRSVPGQHKHPRDVSPT